MLQKKEDATDLQEKSVALKKQTEEAEVAKNELESKRDKAMVGIGNLVHDSVPVHNDEVIIQTPSHLQYKPVRLCRVS